METRIKPTWIWYPGDFEIWQHLKISLRRRERQATVPAFWKLDSFYVNVKFKKDLVLDKPEKVSIFVDGNYHVALDGHRLREIKETYLIPEGRHNLCITVANQSSIPSIYVQGESFISDGSWDVFSYEQCWAKAGYWDFHDSAVPPSKFKLPTKQVFPVKKEENGSSIFLDFGKEIYASLKLSSVWGSGNISIYYGESVDEALATDHCVLIDSCSVDTKKPDFTMPLSAFRYVNIKHDPDIEIKNISALFEYLPVDYRGSFKCSNDRLNQIWEVSRYTLHLNTREFLLDGIKRDGWVWSGDAYQSFLLNYYSFFDEAVNRRTLIALRGKDPIVSHINTIMDYSFYWFLGLYDYCLYTGDLEFLKQYYNKMLTLMDFCLKRRNSNGMMEGLPGDWVFIDWADTDTKGEVSAEQLLLCRSLEVMSTISQMLGESENSERFSLLARELKKKIMDIFWNEDAGGLVTTRLDGKCSSNVTKHANIFALLFGYLDELQLERVKSRVMLNKNIKKIKTPYFRFYELAALCEIGEHKHVMNEMLDYWGGMLDLGATTFWEEYDPTLSGTAHYAMYGEPFDKSLCHAWGASPVYVLGRHYLGVRPLTPGYGTYEVKPNLGTLDWLEGTVPTPEGEIYVYMDKSVIKVKTTAHTGYLRFSSKAEPSSSIGDIKKIGENQYEIKLDSNGQEYVVTYR